jgi:hypothetical protein
MKTNSEIILPMTDIATQIIEKYNCRLPQISNQKFNDYIKDVAAMIESFHEKVQMKITKGGKLQKDCIEKSSLLSHTQRGEQ